MSSAAYRLTRRKGSRATIVQVLSETFDSDTGDSVLETTVTNVRNVHKGPTDYARVYRAQATGQDIGDTMFVFWTRDIKSITRLEEEDYIIKDGVKYMVITSAIEDDGLVITAKHVLDETPAQEIKISVSQSMLSDSLADPVIT